jgi:hypothetical protein
LTALAGVVTAIGVLVKNLRDTKRERRARQRSEKALAKVARAAAPEVVDEIERSGTYKFSIDDDGKP